MGDNTIGAIGRAFRTPPTAKIYNVLKQIDPLKLPDEVARLRVLNNKAERAINSRVEEALKRVRSVIDKNRTERTAAKAYLERTQREVKDLVKRQKFLDLIPAQQMDPMDVGQKKIVYQEMIDELLMNDIPRYQKEIAEKEIVINTLNRLGVATRESPSKVLKMLDTDGVAKKLVVEEESLAELKWAAEALAQRRSEIFNAVSPNIDKPKNFLMEYIAQISKRSADDPIKAAWVLNPRNMARLSELLHGPKYQSFAKKVVKKTFSPEQIAKGQIPKRLLNIANQPASTVAKKLGITITAAASLLSVVELYKWLSSDDTAKIKKDAQGGLADLEVIEAHGEGEVILSQVMIALRNMDAASDSLSKNPNGDTIANFVDVGNNTKAILDQALDQWDVVIKNSKNPSAAKTSRVALEKLRNELETNLDKANEIAGGGGKKPDQMKGQKRQRAKLSKQQVMKVQDYLSQRNQFIGPTGRLDKETVSELQEMEQEYNRLGDTDRFTGKLVDVSKNHMMSVEDLRFVAKQMAKYR